MEFAELAALTIHDVKNRLHVLAGQAEAAGCAEMLRGTLDAAASLTRLLAWYKAEKGCLAVDMDARVPEDLLGELAAEIGRQTPLTVKLDVSRAPALSYYDENLIRMVLHNALSNALRYARREISLSAVDAGQWLEFIVQDDGAGYPAGMLERPLSMQAFSREGTGLGLHLPGHIAALHENAGQRGSIELKNEQGAVFCLRLPQ